GELGLAAALVLAVLSARPPWLVVACPVPGPAPARPEAAPAPHPPAPPEEELPFAWPVIPDEVIPEAAPEPEPAPPQAPPAPEAVEQPQPAGPPQPSWWQTALAALLPGLVVAYALGVGLLLTR